ncbi:SDR family oxidoreductase [Streptomyces bobili]|uniref:SDR family oxidoreductase n=1 Tax=Streptomyces bobili TaxID=67280 RepID=UPI003448AF71
MRVNTVSPGFVRGSIYDSPEDFGGQIAAAFGMDIPTFPAQAPGALGITTGRFVEPAKVASAVVFLLSGAAANITGADHVADGGMLKGRVSVSRRFDRRSRLAPGAAVTRPFPSTITPRRPWVYH